MGLKSRNKGKRGELEACEVLRPLFPNVRRKAMQSRGGSEGADLENTPGLHVEVGIGNVNPRAKWEQAVADAGEVVIPLMHGFDAQIPIALTRRDHGTWLVTMSADAFIGFAAHAFESWRADKILDPAPATAAQLERWMCQGCGAPNGTPHQPGCPSYKPHEDSE